MGLYICLVRILKDGKSESHLMETEKFTFGRAPESSIFLADTSISRQHLRVVIKNGKAFLKDMGSANGTYVDGQKLKNEEIFTSEPGNKIKLGKSECVISLEVIPRKVDLKNLENLPLEADAKSHLQEALTLSHAQYKKTEQQAEELYEKLKKERAAEEEKLFADSKIKAEKAIDEAAFQAKAIIDSAQKKELEIIQDCEKKAQRVSTAIHEDAKLALTAAQTKAGLIEQESRQRGQELIEKAKLAVDSSVELAKKTSEQMRTEAHHYYEDKRKEALHNFDKVLVEAEHKRKQILSQAQQDIEEQKNSLLREQETILKRYESDFQLKVKIFEEDCQAKAKSLDFEHKKYLEEISQVKLELENLNSQRMKSETHLKEKLNEISKMDEKLNLAQAEFHRLTEINIKTEQSTSEALEIRNAAFGEEQTLKMLKENLLLEINQKRNQQQKEIDDFDLEFSGQKQKVITELSEMRRKESDSIQKMRFEELQKIDELREAAFADIRKNEKIFIKGVSEKIESQLVSKLKITQQEIPFKLFQNQIEEIVQTSYDEQSFQSGQSLEKDIRQQIHVETEKRKRSMHKLSIIGLTASFVGLFVFSYNGGSIANLISGLNQKGETAAEAYGRERREERSQRRYEPPQSDNIKASYTENILYTRNYVETKLNNEIQEQWIRDLNKYFSKSLNVDEDDIVKFIAVENTLISRLKEEKEGINPDFIKISLDKMRKIEKESIAEMKKALKDPQNYRQFQSFSEKYWYEKLKNREPASK